VLWRTELLLRPGIGPLDPTVVTVLTELSLLPKYCVLHNVLFLPCHRTRLVTTVFEIYDVSLFRMCILAPYFEKGWEVFLRYSELEYSSLPSRLQIFWMHNIRQFSVCFTPILLVCLQLYST